MENLIHQFILDIRIPGKSPLKITVRNSVTAGLDPRNDIILVGKKVRTKHLVFFQKDDILSLQFLGKENEGFLNSIALEESKNYILEKGDVVQVGANEIIIRHELVHEVSLPEATMTSSLVFDSIDNLSLEGDDNIRYKDNTTKDLFFVKPAPMIKALEDSEVKRQSAPFFSLMVIKLYALLTDIFITYVFLVIVCPLLLVYEVVLNLSKEAALFIHTYMPYPSSMNSFVKFFLVWYLLSLIQTLIFGSTAGQYLLGLKNYTKAETKAFSFFKLFFLRIKTLILALFLIPGQSFVSHHLLFKATRKMGLVFILAFAILSPLILLNFPYNSTLTVLSHKASKKTKPLQTKTISSYSALLGVELKTEHSPRFYLLPLITTEAEGFYQARGFQFFDLKTNTQILIQEIGHINYQDIEEHLEYANPLFSAIHHGSVIAKRPMVIKHLVEEALLLSPVSFTKAFRPFGLFFGSGVLLKKDLLTQFIGENMMASGSTVKFFNKDSPFFLINHEGRELIYLFTEKAISVLSIQSGKELISEIIHDEILSQLRFVHNYEAPSIKSVDILEAMDGYLDGNEQTLLTYYINEANKITQSPLIVEGMNLSENAKRAITENMAFNQKFIKNKDILKSFDELKNVLLIAEQKP